MVYAEHSIFLAHIKIKKKIAKTILFRHPGTVNHSYQSLSLPKSKILDASQGPTVHADLLKMLPPKHSLERERSSLTVKVGRHHLKSSGQGVIITEPIEVMYP